MPRTRGAFFMAEPKPQTPTPTRPRSKRRLPILLRHAISLVVVFAVALPLSYIVGQRIIRHRELSKLDSPDPAVFEDGMDYVYLHAPDDFRVRKEAVQRTQSLPPERAAELFWALAQAMTQDGEPLPPLEISAGAALLERSDFAQKFVVYNQLQQLGVGEDERVLAALASVLEVDDDRRFLQAVEFYDARFLWLPEYVPDTAWLRWAVLLSHSQAALTQLRSAQLLGEMSKTIDDPQLAEGLARLAASNNAMVRSEVLDAAAGYAIVADDPIPYEQVLIALTTDENETLARRAWITLGLLNPISGFSADWRSVEPAIAEAMLWAAVKTNPDHLQPAFEAMETEGYRAAGTLVLSERQQQSAGDPEVDIAIKQVIDAGPIEDEIAVWRAIMVSRDHEKAGPSLIGEFIGYPLSDDVFAHLYLAGAWASGPPDLPSSPDASRYPLLRLARVEGMLDHDHSRDRLEILEPAADWPGIAILAASILKDDESPTLYLEAFSADEPVTRDLAVMAALKSDGTAAFMDAQLRSHKPEAVLASALLAGMLEAHPQFLKGDAARDQTFDELLALSDTQLADLGLRRVDALTTLLDIAESAPDREDRYEQIALLKLALWMRGDLGDDFIPEAEAMLEDDRLPTSTVLMCLLHMQRPAALFYLFDNPDGPSVDLYDLFVNQRWYHVFRRLVPDRDLDLWLWGDPGAQSFQFEVMRQWVQVNRWRLERGWWPGQADEGAGVAGDDRE